MNRIDAFITPHIGDKQFQCDDQFALNLQECRYAIADGSSSDYFSKLYSRILADSFVELGDNLYNKETIDHLNSMWRSEVLKKLEEAGCKPGSFPFVRYQKRDPGCSTLIGLSFKKSENEVSYFKCSGLGDSVLFFISEGDSLPNFQFSSDSDNDYNFKPDINFGYTPVIANSYSTLWLDNIRIVEKKLEKGVFILVTDGLAEWLLHSDQIEELQSRFQRIIAISSQVEFEKFINDIRNNEMAKNDDMTLLKIYIYDEENLNFDLTNSEIYDYRQIALQEESFEKELKRESAEIKRKYEAQNAISLAASEVKLKKEMQQFFQENLDKQLRLAKEAKEREIKGLQEKHRKELKEKELTTRNQVTSEMKKELDAREHAIREDERKKTINDITKSNKSIQSIIASKRQEWEANDLPQIINDARQQWQQTILQQKIDEARQKWKEDDLQEAINEARIKWEEVELPKILKEKEEEWREQHSIKKKIINFVKTKKGQLSSVIFIIIIGVIVGIICFNGCSKQEVPTSQLSTLKENK